MFPVPVAALVGLILAMALFATVGGSVVVWRSIVRRRIDGAGLIIGAAAYVAGVYVLATVTPALFT